MKAGLAITVGLASTLTAAISNLAMAATPSIVETAGAVRGHVADGGVDFSSVLITADRVDIAIDFGLKRIRAEVDYAPERLVIHSVSRSTGTSVSLSAADIGRFQKLLREIPASLKTDGRHVDALCSLLNVVAEAPIDTPLNIDTGAASGGRPGYTPIGDRFGIGSLGHRHVAQENRHAGRDSAAGAAASLAIISSQSVLIG